MHPNHLLVLIISYMQLTEASVSEKHANIEEGDHFFFYLDQQATTVATITMHCQTPTNTLAASFARTCNTHICFRKYVQSGFRFMFIYKITVSLLKMQYQGL